MTRQQFRRMSVFALRMVDVATSRRWQPRLRELVHDCLDRIYGNNDWRCMDDWDHSRQGRHPLLCDEVTRFIWDKTDQGELPRMPECSERESGLAVKLQCCIRAGCDVAVDPSAGVIGWKAGDLRIMWRGRPVPRWVKKFFKDFDSIPSGDGVWL